MHYIMIAIICVAITGTAGVDPTIGAITYAQRGIERSVRALDDKRMTHVCSHHIMSQMTEISGIVADCLGAGRWGLTRLTPPDHVLPAYCCAIHEMFGVMYLWLDRQCIRVSDESNSFYLLVRNKCNESGIDLSDGYCAGQPSSRPMTARCDQFLLSLSAGDSSVTAPDRLLLSSTTRPLPAMGLVLLVAIVVSIAVYVYGF
ncbi:unnamed protein product [Medioppia subpectinata]|uniref:Uncharacterized protein n=1 Tax=Medioppia subpectinata TaxID=1979941 RepID=A0A7R9L024_9ACAR|nr:unnamed protein product [Medioppia subpectinata]CAG2111909.1 unnamed protein product [Medioppia subpectinata]